MRKSFRILEAIAAAGGPVTSQLLAEEAGLTRSTLSRLVLSLEALGYLSRAVSDPGWELGPAAFRLGLARLSSLDIRAVALPLMRDLSKAVDLPVDLAPHLWERRWSISNWPRRRVRPSSQRVSVLACP